MTTFNPRNRRLLQVFVQLLVGALPVLVGSTAAYAGELRRGYIVQLAEQPVASYRGRVGGLRATVVPPGQRLDVSSTAARQYQSYLGSK